MMTCIGRPSYCPWTASCPCSEASSCWDHSAMTLTTPPMQWSRPTPVPVTATSERHSAPSSSPPSTPTCRMVPPPKNCTGTHLEKSTRGPSLTPSRQPTRTGFSGGTPRWSTSGRNSYLFLSKPPLRSLVQASPRLWMITS